MATTSTVGSDTPNGPRDSEELGKMLAEHDKKTADQVAAIKKRYYEELPGVLSAKLAEAQKKIIDSRGDEILAWCVGSRRSAPHSTHTRHRQSPISSAPPPPRPHPHPPLPTWLSPHPFAPTRGLLLLSPCCRFCEADIDDASASVSVDEYSVELPEQPCVGMASENDPVATLRRWAQRTRTALLFPILRLWHDWLERRCAAMCGDVRRCAAMCGDVV